MVYKPAWMIHWKESLQFPGSKFSKDEVFRSGDTSVVVVLPRELEEWWNTETTFTYYLW